MELAFIEEAIPKIVRAGGSGREAEPWEQHIAPLRKPTRRASPSVSGPTRASDRPFPVCPRFGSV